MITEQRRNSARSAGLLMTAVLPRRVVGSYEAGQVSAGHRYRTSSPVTARPMIIRWISDVPSKMVKILASRCHRSTG